MKLELEIDEQKIREIAGRLKNALRLKEALSSAGDYVLQRVALNFKKEQDPEGRKWPDLSEVTKNRRRGKRYKILRDSGTLRSSFTKKVSDDEVVVGTAVEYAPTHQFGAKQGEFGTVEVKIREHVRKIKLRRKKKKLRGKAKGQKEKIIKVTVSEHTRKMQIPWGDIPARPFLGITEEGEEEIMSIVADRIRRQLGY